MQQNTLQKLDHFRLQLHFKVVEQRLRLRDTNHLSQSAQQAREQHLRRLRAYGERGIFPRNETHPGFRPCFIDQAGRECAVAHLLIESGEGVFANRIVETHNPAFVREMFYPELDMWAGEAGFTKEELQMIQPAYPPTSSEIALMRLIQLGVQLSGMVVTLGLTGFLWIALRTLISLKDKGMVIKLPLLPYFSSGIWKALFLTDKLFLLLLLPAIGIFLFCAFLWMFPRTMLSYSPFSVLQNESVFNPLFQAFLNKLFASGLCLIVLVFLYWGQVRPKSHMPNSKTALYINLVLAGVVVYWIVVNYLTILPFNPVASNNVWVELLMRNPVLSCLREPAYPMCP